MGTGSCVAAKSARQLLGPGSVVVRNLLKEEELGALAGGSPGVFGLARRDVEMVKLPIELGGIMDSAEAVQMLSDPAQICYYLLLGEYVGLRGSRSPKRVDGDFSPNQGVIGSGELTIKFPLYEVNKNIFAGILWNPLIGKDSIFLFFHNIHLRNVR